MRRSKPIVDFSPCPGSTTVSSSSTNSFVTIEPSRSRPLPPGRSVRPDRSAEQGVAGEDNRRPASASSGDPEHDRAAGVAGRVVDRHGDAAQFDLVAVAVQLDDLPRFAEQRAERHLRQPRPEILDRVGQHEPVLGMDVGRAAVRVGHLLRRPDVVDVAVGQQHRRRGQAVLVEDPPQRPIARWPGSTMMASAPARGAST